MVDLALTVVTAAMIPAVVWAAIRRTRAARADPAVLGGPAWLCLVGASVCAVALLALAAFTTPGAGVVLVLLGALLALSVGDHLLVRRNLRELDGQRRCASACAARAQNVCDRLYPGRFLASAVAPLGAGKTSTGELACRHGRRLFVEPVDAAADHVGEEHLRRIAGEGVAR